MAWRTGRGDVRRLSLLAFATMAMLVGLGRVYSPQYLLWLISLGGVALTFLPRQTRWAIGLLAATVVLTHIEFPYWYFAALEDRETVPIVVLLVRNLLTIGVGIAAFVGWWAAGPRKTVSTPGDSEEVTTGGPEPSALKGGAKCSVSTATSA